MRTKTNIFPTNLRQECGADAPQYGRLLSLCAGDAPQKEKILRPECGAEAPTFLSAVYKRGTQAKKRQAYAPQYGRSMIEMLGVLAIIGVLTVGSITGYSRAMRRHLLNKQREQYNYILSAIEAHRDMLYLSTNSTLPNNLKPIFETFGWIPEEMIKDTDNVYIYDVFDNKALFRSGNINTTHNMINLFIYFANNNPYQQCINIYQLVKTYSSILWRIEISYLDKSGKRNYVSYTYGDKYCNTTQPCIHNMTPSKISQLCQNCNDIPECSLLIGW